MNVFLGHKYCYFLGGLKNLLFQKHVIQRNMISKKNNYLASDIIILLSRTSVTDKECRGQNTCEKVLLRDAQII